MQIILEHIAKWSDPAEMRLRGGEMTSREVLAAQKLLTAYKDILVTQAEKRPDYLHEVVIATNMAYVADRKLHLPENETAWTAQERQTAYAVLGGAARTLEHMFANTSAPRM